MDYLSFISDKQLELTENNDKIIQPDTIDIDLMEHQKTIVNRMLKIEENATIDIDIDIESNSKKCKLDIKTNVGILGDKVGAGKTLTIVSLLSIKKLSKEYPKFYGSNHYSMQIYEHYENIDCNLVIVPQKLILQWVDAFKHASNLNIYPIYSNKHISELIKLTADIQIKPGDANTESENIIKLNIDKINKFDVILVGNTMIKNLLEYTDKYKWNRIIVDEACTIKIPTQYRYKFNFLWLISGTPYGIRSRYSAHIIFKIFYEMGNYIKFFIIRNNTDYVNNSIILPKINRIKINCLTPVEINILKKIIPPSILQMINAGNTEQAIKTLNCNVDTSENIFQIITAKILNNINNKKTELDIEINKIYPLEKIKEQEYNIKILQTAIKRYEEKYEFLRKKMYELNNEYCPICMDKFINPVIVNCCQNCYCFNCLALSMGSLNNNKCPFCRQQISKNDMHVISEDKIDTSNEKIIKNKSDKVDKMDKLLEIIQKKPDGSFIIFANYSDTFTKIENKLNELHISYHILKGQTTSINRYINDFSNKKTQVLMLNAQYFGAGMNLQMTTDLIIFHRFDKFMEEQIIGRAQRLGRTIPLNVYYLLHENEQMNDNLNFKFEDIDENEY